MRNCWRAQRSEVERRIEFCMADVDSSVVKIRSVESVQRLAGFWLEPKLTYLIPLIAIGLHGTAHGSAAGHASSTHLRATCLGVCFAMFAEEGQWKRNQQESITMLRACCQLLPIPKPLIMLVTMLMRAMMSTSRSRETSGL